MCVLRYCVHGFCVCVWGYKESLIHWPIPGAAEAASRCAGQSTSGWGGATGTWVDACSRRCSHSASSGRKAFSRRSVIGLTLDGSCGPRTSLQRLVAFCTTLFGVSTAGPGQTLILLLKSCCAIVYAVVLCANTQGQLLGKVEQLHQGFRYVRRRGCWAQHSSGTHMVLCP